MTIVRTTFDRAGDLYSRLFSDWLHIHFIIRTVLLLLVLWLIIYIAAQIFQYVIAPILLFIFYNTIFRMWNYFAVETPQEWIYVRYFSQDKPKFRERYLRLCDKVKRNRKILSNMKYRILTRRSKKITLRLIIVCAVVATLWVGAFGLHHEYAVPAIAQALEANTSQTLGYQPTDDIPEIPIPVARPAEPPPWLDPSLWDAADTIFLYLNDLGQPGARLRDGPGILGHTVIEILWNDDRIQFLHSYYPDADVRGLYWLHVLSPHGTKGYISSQLVAKE